MCFTYSFQSCKNFCCCHSQWLSTHKMHSKNCSMVCRHYSCISASWLTLSQSPPHELFFFCVDSNVHTLFDVQRCGQTRGEEKKIKRIKIKQTATKIKLSKMCSNEKAYIHYLAPGSLSQLKICL